LIVPYGWDSKALFLLPLREKVASEGGRMRGRAPLPDSPLFDNLEVLRDPSSVGFADTFSRKGRRTPEFAFSSEHPAP
jgi:hypothetical protein